jgi:aminopeptidase N
MDKNIGNFISNYEYVVVTYSRGHMMFADIYRILGEESFQKAARYYVKRNKYKIAKKSDLTDALNKYAVSDIRENINEWINFTKK